MNNKITWNLEDYEVEDDENEITHLNIFRIPSYMPIDRENLFEPYATVFVDDLEFEDEFTVEGEKYRYFVSPKNIYSYTDAEWPTFDEHPGLIQVQDNGIDKNVSINTFGYKSDIISVIPKFDKKEADKDYIAAKITVATFNYFSNIDTESHGEDNE